MPSPQQSLTPSSSLDIDPEPTSSQRAAAEALITAERALVPDDPFHALLPAAPQPSKHLTPFLEAELSRAATGTKLSALDFSRYEAVDPPSLSSDTPSETARAELSSALSRAYTSHKYVAGRRAHLALLDSYGKNAWLVGNWQLEGELKRVERELADAKRAIDVVSLQRRNAQAEVAAEMTGLDEAWRKGVGRVLETEAAAEKLRRDVLEVRAAQS
jgi:pre-mRNA-splicing factor SPF27